MASIIVIGRDYIIQQEYVMRIKALTVLHSSFFYKVSGGVADKIRVCAGHQVCFPGGSLVKNWSAMGDPG